MKKKKENWKAHILTLFPEMFPGPLGYSIVGKALEEKVWSLKLINLQNFSKKGPKYIDDKPVENHFRSHQVPLSDPINNEDHFQQLEKWMRSYQVDQLFDDEGTLKKEYQLANS